MKLPVLALLLFVIGLNSCQSSKVSTSNQSTDSLVSIGGKKNEHGCLVSAGYNWSKLKNNCIRPFEEGIALLRLDSTASYQTAAYALIDSTKQEAEIYVTEQEESILLKKESVSKYTNGEFNLEQKDHCWTISHNSTPLYQEKK